MLPETPLLMAFEKKTYRKIRQKTPIKTLPKTSPIFFSKTDHLENLLNKYPANVLYKILGKVRSHKETVLKRSSKTFWTEKLPKTPKNLDFEKKTVSKILSKSTSYTEVAYNTVETPLSGNRSDSRGSSNSHRTKNQP